MTEQQTHCRTFLFTSANLSRREPCVHPSIHPVVMTTHPSINRCFLLFVSFLFVLYFRLLVSFFFPLHFLASTFLSFPNIFLLSFLPYHLLFSSLHRCGLRRTGIATTIQVLVLYNLITSFHAHQLLSSLPLIDTFRLYP